LRLLRGPYRYRAVHPIPPPRADRRCRRILSPLRSGCVGHGLRVIGRPHRVRQVRIDRPVDKRRASHPLPPAAFKSQSARREVGHAVAGHDSRLHSPHALFPDTGRGTPTTAGRTSSGCSRGKAVARCRGRPGRRATSRRSVKHRCPAYQQWTDGARGHTVESALGRISGRGSYYFRRAVRRSRMGRSPL
jgi:hypothetical protein